MNDKPLSKKKIEQHLNLILEASQKEFDRNKFVDPINKIVMPEIQSVLKITVNSFKEKLYNGEFDLDTLH